MVNRVHDIPGDHKDSIPMAVGASAATGYGAAYWVAPFDCFVTDIQIQSEDAITGHGTNTHNFNADGPSNATEIANLDLGAASNLVAFTDRSLAGLASGGVSFSEGEAIRMEGEEVGTGQAGAHDYVWTVTYRGR